MEKNRTLKTLAIAALLFAVIGTGIAFAALSTTLNITGSADITAPNWDIHFDNLGTTPIETGNGKADTVTTPTLTTTSITNIKGIFDDTGTVGYEFDVVNGGAIDAQIGSITMAAAPTCTGTGANAVADAALVCGAITTSLTNATGGSVVAVGDTLDAGVTKRMIFTINYNPAGTHPDNAVTVTGLGATIVYDEY